MEPMEVVLMDPGWLKLQQVVRLSMKKSCDGETVLVYPRRVILDFKAYCVLQVLWDPLSSFQSIGVREEFRNIDLLPTVIPLGEPPP